MTITVSELQHFLDTSQQEAGSGNNAKVKVAEAAQFLARLHLGVNKNHRDTLLKEESSCDIGQIVH